MKTKVRYLVICHIIFLLNVLALVYFPTPQAMFSLGFVSIPLVALFSLNVLRHLKTPTEYSKQEITIIWLIASIPSLLFIAACFIVGTYFTYQVARTYVNEKELHYSGASLLENLAGGPSIIVFGIICALYVWSRRPNA